MKTLKFLCLSPLLVLLVSCGGGNGGSSAGVAASPPPVTPAPPAPVPVPPPDPVPVPPPVPGPTPTPVPGKNVLFVADAYNNVLVAFDTLAPAGATAVTGKVLTSDFSLRGSVELDASRNLLYVSASADIAVFSNATELNGKIVPVRTFTPILFPDANPSIYLSRIVLDSANDRMYVAYGGGPGYSTGFAVFDRVSTMHGAVTPTRIVTGGGMHSSNFALDLKRGLLYTKLSHLQSTDILVFANMDKASGSISAARQINFSGNVSALGIDTERDILYAGIQGVGLTALHNASTTNSVTSSTPTTRIPLVSNSGLFAVDSRNDRLYIAIDRKAYILSQASKLGLAGQEAVLSLNVGTSFNVTGFAFP